VRYRATNALAVKNHPDCIESLIQTHHIDPRRITKLEETVATPSKLVTTRRKGYGKRGQQVEFIDSAVANTSRVTLMGIIFGSGDVGRPAFMLKGIKLRYMIILVVCAEFFQSLATTRLAYPLPTLPGGPLRLWNMSPA